MSSSGDRSQLNSVVNAALVAYFANPQTYRELYASYLQVVPKFIPACSGGWVNVEPGTLSRVLTNGVLRIGYAESAPYVFHRDGKLTGIEWELGNALAAIIGTYYAGYKAARDLRVEWVEVKVTEQGDPEQVKFNALYRAMKDHDLFDLALSGQANIGSDPTVPEVEWTSPTELLFTNVLYTGRGDYDLRGLIGATRDAFIDTVKDWPLIEMMCVVNQGPSRTNTLKLVEDIVQRGGTVNLKDDCTVPEITEAVVSGDIHFTAGDAVASSWQAVQYGPPKLNLDIAAAIDPRATAQEVAGFTLRPK
jgi:hypothetical protein